MTGQLPARRPDFGELGPAMQALSEQRRDFVYHYVTAPPKKGSLVEAYRQAGYGQGSTPTIQAKAAWRLSRDARVLAAITEESKKILRVAFPEAANALVNLVRDDTHREHGRAIQMIMDRAFPVETKHNIEVVHTTKDSDTEGVELLREYRKQGWTRDALEKVFGGNGLPRIEALEAADARRRAQEAKVIDGEVIEAEVMPDASPDEPSAEPAYARDPEEDDI
jgi:phage terminase small subunit